MRKIITIYKKELKDSLRDRRTLFMMIVLPMILIPGIILLMTKVQMAQAKKAMEKEIKVAFIGGEFYPGTDSDVCRKRKDSIHKGLPG